MDNLWSDKVVRSMCVFAIGVVFTILQFTFDYPNKLYVTLGFIWCLASIVLIVKNIRDDWKK